MNHQRIVRIKIKPINISRTHLCFQRKNTPTMGNVFRRPNKLTLFACVISNLMLL